MYCFVVVFSLQFKQLQRVVTIALKSLYRVCVIKKLDLILSNFSVRSQNHLYKNSVVFRLACHLCSSTSLVLFIVLEPNYLHQLLSGTRTAASMAVFQTFSATRLAGNGWKGSGYVRLVSDLCTMLFVITICRM